MRLLNTSSGRLQFFEPNQAPDYAILSHRWLGAEDELRYHDISDESAHDKRDYAKAHGACNLAKADGYDWIWIDSCCINQESAADLQESINSMWNYYARANVCYVYMQDVLNSEFQCGPEFQASDWFQRGWTL